MKRVIPAISYELELETEVTGEGDTAILHAVYINSVDIMHALKKSERLKILNEALLQEIERNMKNGIVSN